MKDSALWQYNITGKITQAYYSFKKKLSYRKKTGRQRQRQDQGMTRINKYLKLCVTDHR